MTTQGINAFLVRPSKLREQLDKSGLMWSQFFNFDKWEKTRNSFVIKNKHRLKRKITRKEEPIMTPTKDGKTPLPILDKKGEVKYPDTPTSYRMAVRGGRLTPIEDAKEVD